MPATSSRPSPSAAERLDPCLLGRPMHLLPRFAALLREDLARSLQAGLNRRWGADFRVGPMTIVRSPSPAVAGRWLAFESASGRIGMALDRSVLLAVLGYRYGTTASDATPEAGPEAVRETATEERLAISLGQQWVALLAARIAAGLHAPERDAHPARHWHPRPGAAPEEGAWTMRATIEEPARGVSGALTFALDDAAMARLLRTLAPARKRQSRTASTDRPIAQRLQVTLTGCLVRKEMALGDVLDLRPGAIVPVRLDLADVMVGDSRLFTAAVAECKGKLCLTSFEDLE